MFMRYKKYSKVLYENTLLYISETEINLCTNTVQLRLKALLRTRKEGALTRSPVPRCLGFLERNFDTGFFTTLGLFL